MTGFVWDPAVYDQFEDARARPFHDLVGRIGATAPRLVVDVGCGTGRSTVSLAERWPGAQVLGTDRSAEMLADAPTHDRVRFEVADLTTRPPGPDADVVVCNAVLQWVPDHLSVVQRWAADLPAGGWLAVQLPANFDAPSHALMRQVAERWPAARAALRQPDAVETTETWAVTLLDAGLVVDAWETTYLHVLTGEDPVLRWVRGTGLRPALAALGDEDRAEFERAYAAALRQAYPRRPDGTTLLPFRRRFAVGRRP